MDAVEDIFFYQSAEILWSAASSGYFMHLIEALHVRCFSESTRCNEVNSNWFQSHTGAGLGDLVLVQHEECNVQATKTC